MNAASYRTPRSGPPRLPLQWRVVQVLAALAAAALLAWVLAHWAWRWWGPRPEVALPVRDDLAGAAAVIAVAPWFGAASNAGAPAAFEPGPTLGGDVRLLGVVAASSGAGYALFRLPDRGAVLVRTGEDVVAGVRLEAVTPATARVRERGGVREIALRPSDNGAQPGSTVPAAPSGAANAGPGVTSARAAAAPTVQASSASARSNSPAACVPPGGSTAAPYRLNAELLAGISARPDTLASAFNLANGALVVREGNGFAAMLGMQAGDRLTHANGIALNGTDDVLIGVIRPLMASQAVRVVGVRDGRHLEWVLVNAGACPP